MSQRDSKPKSGPPDRLRILFTPPRYTPYVGGVEEHCRGYARELARRGHEVMICCAEEGPAPGCVDGIPVRRCRTALKVANTNVTPGLPLYLALARADVIHTFLPTPWSADWSAIAGKLRGKPVVLTYANDIVGQGGAGAVAEAYNRLVLPNTLRLADVILVSSARYAEASRHLAPYRRKVEVLPPGVDTDHFSPGAAPRWPATFFFLSVLDEFHGYKGLDILLLAMARARQATPAIRLIVGGAGSLLTKYQGLARQLGIGDAVEFRGHLAEEERLHLYRQCTAFVLPSVSAAQEGFGMVAVEAVACGAPVIVSDVVGIAEEVAGSEVGLVVPPNSVDALAAALIALATESARFRLDRWRSLAAMWSWNARGARLEGLYRDIHSGGRLRPCVLRSGGWGDPVGSAE